MYTYIYIYIYIYSNTCNHIFPSPGLRGKLRHQVGGPLAGPSEKLPYYYVMLYHIMISYNHMIYHIISYCVTL